MRSLIWSEWRTKRLWGLPLVAAVILPLLLGNAFTYWGEPVTANPAQQLYGVSEWLMPAALIALLFGAMAFAGELGMGTQDFLLSRPVGWKRLLAAKVIVGLGIIAGVALVGAVVFRMVCPDQYLRFLSVERYAGGVGMAVALMGVPYLVGVACSVVLPGVIGSVLMLLAVAVALGVELVILGMLPDDRLMYTNPAVLVVPWAVGLILAAVLVVRFGLTLSLASRAKKYAAAVLGCVVCLTPIVAVTHTDVPPEVTTYSYNFSPNMSHMILTKESPVHLLEDPKLDHFTTKSYYMQRFSDGRRVRIFVPDDWGVKWIAEDTVVWLRRRTRRVETGRGWVTSASLERARMDAGGNVVTRRVELGDRIEPAVGEVSPGGKLMLLRVYRSAKTHYESELEAFGFLDLKAMKVLDVRLDSKVVGGRYWWQSDSVFAWSTLSGQVRRYVVKG